MDPYNILGVPYNSTWKQVKKAYKEMLIRTHPDKMNGNAKYFMMVHDAFSTIEKQHQQSKRQRSYPTERQQYVPDNQRPHQKPNEQFNISNFNSMFERYAQEYNKTDPYLNGGYKTSERLNYQEDDTQLRSNKVNIPKRQLVIYKEPEALVSSSLMDNVQHLGVNKIDDYTCRNGSDYMRAYSEEAELIDNRQNYKSVDHLTQVRKNQNFAMTQEDRKLQQELEQNRQQLEQMRLRNVNKNDRRYAKINSIIENRLL